MSNTPVATFALLNGVPTVDVKENRRIAMNSGRRTTAVLREMLTLQRASSGRPNTYTAYSDGSQPGIPRQTSR